ncbi:glycoside hydrolase family 25 protein [Flavobacterium okayamense]|uniref:Glycosyl hydrolase n=1 Tax=Flavobacterium okayamense TaxID=2830782 RepID=A0ABN6HRG3_9FLAO|nr:glycoside hydrolase family 25 protein [Flavobacterium okayamense]BCY27225.1 glycosyl hydrolase [Flavobacterium okayamense]
MAKTIKRKTYSTSKNKPKTNREWKVVGYLFLFFVLLGIGIFAYEYGDGVLYYLGFKTKNYDSLSKEDREIVDIHIYEVLDSHKDFMVGFDVSEYQKKIDWENLGKIEDTFSLDFVFIRATAGKDKKDKRFKENWKNAKKKGIIRGAYHYYRPNENSIQQANNFIATVKIEQGDLPPVLDIEKLPRTQSLDSLKIGLRRWLDRVEQHYKMKPIIYSGESYYTDFLKKEFSDYPFWIANYNFWKKHPDKHWLIWQFTEKAQIEGINGLVDVNLFNGDFVRLVETTKK